MQIQRSRCPYPIAQLLQDVDFYQSLLMEPLLVSNDLDSHQSARLVINASDNLTKAAFPKDVDDFVSVREVISYSNTIIATIVVIAKVCRVR